MSFGKLTEDQLLAERMHYEEKLDGPGASEDDRRVAEARLKEIRAEQERREARQNGRIPRKGRRWGHVDLVQLIRESGCKLEEKGDGKFKGDHAIKHGSKSGECMVVWREEGRWYCSSCKETGDAAGWVAHVEGIGYKEAAKMLRERFGPGPMDEEEWLPPTPFYQIHLPPFPTDAFPRWLREYVEGLATATQTPPDLAAMLALSMLAAALAKKVEVCVREGWIEPVNIYTATTLPPGNRKTAVTTDVTRPMEEYERAEVQRMAPETARAKAEYEIAEARLQHCKSQAAKGQKPEDADPYKREAMDLQAKLPTMIPSASPRLIADDCTPEKMASLLCEHGGRMAVFSAEGDIFDQMAGRYSDIPNLGVFLRGHSGDPLRVDRVGRPPEYVKGPAITIGVAPQPEVIRGLMNQATLRGRGLLARILYSWPETLLGRRKVNPPPVPFSVSNGYQRNILSLLKLPFGTDDSGEQAPHMLSPDPTAHRQLLRFESEVERDLGEFGDMANMTDWGGKLVGAVVRIAGLLHVAEHTDNPAPWATPISLETVEHAIRVGQYLIPHARAAFAEMGASPDVESAKRILRWMEHAGVTPFTKRDAYQGTKGYFKRVEAMAPALKLLEEHGHIRQQHKGEHTGPGRPPSPKYDVNPLLNSQSPPDLGRQINSGDCGNIGNAGDGLDGRSNISMIGPRETKQHDNRGPGRTELRYSGDPVGEQEENCPPLSHNSQYSPNSIAGDAGSDNDRREVASQSSLQVTVTRPEFRVDHTVLDSAEAVQAVLPKLLAAPAVGLDTETTGLNPQRDRVRTVQLAIPGETFIIDAFKVDPAILGPVLEAGSAKIFHNAKFDLQFLGVDKLAVCNIYDTMITDQVLRGSRKPRSLAELAAEYAAIPLDKALQKSDWSVELTPEQLVYAARDAAVLLPLYEKLRDVVQAAELTACVQLENLAVPAIAWMEYSGAPFDTGAWRQRADAALAERLRLEAQLNEIARAELKGRSGQTNWESHKQVLEVLQALGLKIDSTCEDVLVAVKDEHPIVATLLEYRKAKTSCGTYGLNFLAYIDPNTGRIHSDWRQVGTESGRMACQRPNLQGISRTAAYRACFRAPGGRVLVKADYSQIELRIAAQIAGEQRMIDAYQRGEDLHKLTASLVMAKNISEVTNEDRQAAKAVNFGLLYGMGCATLAGYALKNYRVELSLKQAGQFREAFFRAYPALKVWHRSQPDGAVDVRTGSGRRRRNVTSFTRKLNTPVQGTGADGLKAALALLWETRNRCPSALPVLTVHDEIVIECDEQDAETAKEWLTDCMRSGMGQFLKKVPVDVEASVGRDWSMVEKT